MDDDAAVRRLPDGGGAVDRSRTRAGFGGANYDQTAGGSAGSTRASNTKGVDAGTGRRGCGSEIGISVRRVHRIFGGDGGQYATSR